MQKLQKLVSGIKLGPTAEWPTGRSEYDVRVDSDRQHVGLKIGRELRNHFSYPDPISADVERHYDASGRKLPKDFTGFMSRRDRLREQQNDGTGSIAETLPTYPSTREQNNS